MPNDGNNNQNNPQEVNNNPQPQQSSLSDGKAKAMKKANRNFFGPNY